MESTVVTNEEIYALIPKELIGYFSADPSTTPDLSGFDSKFFIDYIINEFNTALSSVVAVFLTLLTLTVISSIIKSFSSSLGERNSASVNFVSSICAAASVYGIVFDKITSSLSTVDSFGTLLSSAAPIISAIYIASGKITTAVITSSETLFTVSIASTLTHSLLIPILRICFAFRVISALLGENRLASASRFLKNTFLYATGGIMTLISGILALQSVVTQSADTASVRAARFALGTLPIVGSAIAEASRTLFGAMDLLKNIVGGIGIIILLLTLIPPIIDLFLYKITFTASKILAASLDCRELVEIIEGCEEMFSFAIAIILIFNLTAIFTLSVFLAI